MEIDEVVDELCFFASNYRFYSLSELTDLAEHGVHRHELRSALLADSRFICLGSEPPEEDHFILDSTLFHWFIRLNMRLAEVGLFRLTGSQVARRMSLLRQGGRWSSLPHETISWGQRFGLICSSVSKEQFVFPLAHVFSHISPSCKHLMTDISILMRQERIWTVRLQELIEKSLKEGFSEFKEEVVYVVQNREGLLTGKKMTLEEVGNTMQYTRQWAQQVEQQFWGKLRSRWLSYRVPFLVAFICYFMDVSGSLVVTLDSPEIHLVTFLAKCVGVPYTKLSKLGVLVLSFSAQDLASLQSSQWSLDEIDASVIAERLESRDQVAMLDKDLKKLAERVAPYRQKRLQRTQKVALALRSIGRPAHYSEVTDVHNSLWPDDAANEHNVHAALSRGEHGVVWIGIQGTFALKEWGYERPSKYLHDAVAEIVEKKYEETGKPVPFSIVSAEIGKYRQVVKSSSIAFAVHFNPRIQSVHGESFIPADSNGKKQGGMSPDDLDKVLHKFKEKV